MVEKQKSPKVSVCITTYNHAAYIKQAIDSVLMQETDFEFEILIGEDDSDDGTREIVKRYAEEFPNNIRLFLNDRKNVIYIDGKPTGRWNFINNLTHAQGKYLVFLDGDDYWTNPNKLQKQFEFLNKNIECSMVFHPVIINQETRGEPNTELRFPDNKFIYDLNELLENLNFIHTSSVMIRNWIQEDIPEWFHESPIGDWSIYVLTAETGLAGFIDETMSVYRMHEGGIHTSQSVDKRITDVVRTYRIFQENLEPQYKQAIKRAISHQSDYALSEANQSLLKNQIHKSRRLFILALRIDPHLFIRLLLGNYKILVMYLIVFILGQYSLTIIQPFVNWFHRTK